MACLALEEENLLEGEVESLAVGGWYLVGLFLSPECSPDTPRDGLSDFFTSPVPSLLPFASPPSLHSSSSSSSFPSSLSPSSLPPSSSSSRLSSRPSSSSTVFRSLVVAFSSLDRLLPESRELLSLLSHAERERQTER